MYDLMFLVWASLPLVWREAPEARVQSSVSCEVGNSMRFHVGLEVRAPCSSQDPHESLAVARVCRRAPCSRVRNRVGRTRQCIDIVSEERATQLALVTFGDDAGSIGARGEKIASHCLHMKSGGSWVSGPIRMRCFRSSDLMSTRTLIDLRGWTGSDFMFRGLAQVMPPLVRMRDGLRCPGFASSMVPQCLRGGH